MMTKDDRKVKPPRVASPLSENTDFYKAWEMVNSADTYTATVRARAFAIWVALFGSVDADGVVTLNSSEVAEDFSVSRASWLHYRELLSEVGLIEQRPVESARQRKTVRLLPPVRS